MKSKIFIWILSVFVFSFEQGRAQTLVSGGIYSNTIWSKINSPYIVTGNIVLFPSKVLTIEPGVSIKFNGNYDIEIRGKLIAIGTITDSISFVSNISNVQGAWHQIKVVNGSQNAIGYFDYCIFKHSWLGLDFGCCFGVDSGYVKNSSFELNHVGISGYTAWRLTIDKCRFSNNQEGISGADKNINNCQFNNNGTALNITRYAAKNCLFQNNGIAIQNSGAGASNDVIDSCIIINNGYGVSINNGTIMNCEISNNNVGINCGHNSATVNGIPYYVPIFKNKICNNTMYNVLNTNSHNKNIRQNCFCTTDSAIIELKLKDGYDDITKGLFNYDIFDSTCQVLTKTVFKVGPTFIKSYQNNIAQLKISPNPSAENFSIQFNNFENSRYILTINNTIGQKLFEYENIFGNQENINIQNLADGFYILNLIKDNIIYGQLKLIKN